MKNQIQNLLFVCCIFAFTIAKATEPANSNLSSKKELLFIENKGQITDTEGNPRPDILYTLNNNSVTIFVSNNGLYYQFSKVEDSKAADIKNNFDKLKKNEQVKTCLYRLDMQLLDANKNAIVTTEEETPYYENYYNVATHLEGITHIRSFKKITVKNVYDKIDWVLYIKDKGLKYDFVVKPGGAVSDIKMKYNDDVKINELPEGGIEITTPLGKIEEGKPLSYEIDSEKKLVASRFVRYKKNVLGFMINKSNFKSNIIIDPSIVWASYYGGNSTDIAYACATDFTSGSSYIGGHTSSTTGIAFNGFQNSLIGGGDAFLVKFDSNGNRLWATYFGGTGNPEFAYGCTTDIFGNVYLAGYTASSSGITYNGFQNSFGGGNDAFLVKFDINGTRLWATYYGGSSNELGNSCSTDSNGNIYLTGYTASSTAISFNGFQNNYSGSTDAFLVKFDNNGNRLWATYYGGSNSDEGNSCSVDYDGNVFLAGSTQSATGISYNGHQNVLGSASGDGFLVKFDSTGNRLWATYYGGPNLDNGYSCTTDNYGNVYLAGKTQSLIGIAYNGYQNAFMGVSDAFLAKFDNSNCYLYWATYYGNIFEDGASGCIADNAGNIYLTGTTRSLTGIAYNGFQNSFGGGLTDAFLVKFDFGGARKWATYYGGSSDDFSNNCTTDNLGSLYVTGSTASSNGIAFNGFQNNFGGSSDAFLNKIFICDSLNVQGNHYLCNGSSATISVLNDSLFTGLAWNTGSTNSSITVSTPGTYSVSAISNVCFTTVTSNWNVSQYPGCAGFLEITSDTAINYFDTLHVEVKIHGAVNIFSVFAKIGFDSNLLKLVESTTGSFFGSNIFYIPPIVSGDSIDFGITKTNGQPGSYGDGTIYSFKFVLTNLPNLPFNATSPSFTFTQFGLASLSVYDTLGTHPPSFNAISIVQTQTKIKYYVPVWPGDLNNDFKVNVADILPIGYFYNATGPVRPNGSLMWVAQPAPLWGFDKTFQNSNAYKTFADGNADGQVSLADQAAIGFNLNQVHLRFGHPQENTELTYVNKVLSTPVLSVNISQDSVLSFPTLIAANINAGSLADPLTNVYGLAFDVFFNPTCVNTSGIVLNFSNVFGVLNSDYIRIVDTTQITQGRISVGITRFNSTPITLTGAQILSINFVLNQGCSNSNCNFSVIPNVLGCNEQNGAPLSLNATGDSVVTCFVGINENESENKILVYPNPTNDILSIEWKEFLKNKVEIRLYDMLGNCVKNKFSYAKQNSKVISLKVEDLSKGVYFLNLNNDTKNKTIKIVVQ